MYLHKLLREAGIPWGPRLPDLHILGVTCHTDRVTRNSLFVCIKGTRQNGAALALEAVKKGATVLLAHPEDAHLIPPRIPCIFSQNPRRCLSRLMDAWEGHPAGSLKLIGITGTNGKTSVAEMLFHILNQTGHPTGVIGTLGCRTPRGSIPIFPPDPNANMTTPAPEELYPTLSAMGDMEYAIMEVTSHALVQERVEPLHFVRGVFTNLSPDHLDLHGSMEAYAHAKAILFGKVEKAILYTPDPYAGVMWDHATGEVIACCGIHLHYGSACPAPGGFTPVNASLAGLTAESLGIPQKKILTALSTFRGVPGRMEEVRLEGADFSLYLDYAHTPDALREALLTARALAGEGRVILLFGCGGDRDRTKRPLMGSIAAEMSDLICLTSDNPRTEDPMEILCDVRKGIPEDAPLLCIHDRAEAIGAAIENARPHDLLLFAGKGHEKYQIDRDGRHPFDEKEIARRFYGKTKGIGK